MPVRQTADKAKSQITGRKKNTTIKIVSKEHHEWRSAFFTVQMFYLSGTTCIKRLHRYFSEKTL